MFTLDEHGQFVVCRMCRALYAVYGGEEPEPVAMSAPFCTRLWVEHKRSAHQEPIAVSQQASDLVIKIESSAKAARGHAAAGDQAQVL